MKRYVAAILSAAAFACSAVQAVEPPIYVCSRCFGPAGDEPVDIFAAVQDGLLDARVIVRDQFHGKILLRNLSTQPLAVTLPDFLAARPVLAQQGFQFPGLSGQQGNNPFGGNQQSLPQSVGGSPSNSPGGSIFNIAPEQVRIVDFSCFCLEQGKPNPRTGVAYELAPLDEVNDDERLPHLFAAFARGEIDRDAAQAAVWHAADDLDWEALAGLSQRVGLNASRRVFNSQELRKAKALVDRAEQTLAEAEADEAAATKDKLAAAAKIRL